MKLSCWNKRKHKIFTWYVPPNNSKNVFLFFKPFFKSQNNTIYAHNKPIKFIISLLQMLHSLQKGKDNFLTIFYLIYFFCWPAADVPKEQNKSENLVIHYKTKVHDMLCEFRSAVLSHVSLHTKFQVCSCYKLSDEVLPGTHCFSWWGATHALQVHQDPACFLSLASQSNIIKQCMFTRQGCLHNLVILRLFWLQVNLLSKKSQ